MLLRPRGAYNDDGEWVVESSTQVPIMVSTVPVSGNARGDGLIRRLLEGGVQLDATRLFFTVEDLVPTDGDTAGDFLLYRGQRWRVRQSQRFAHYSESLCVRVEDDPLEPE